MAKEGGQHPGEDTAARKQPAQRIPWWRDPAKRAVVIQLALVALTAWALLGLIDNTVNNLNQRGIKTTFSFLTDTATFSIPLNFSPLWEFTLGESQYWEVFVIGIQNTVLVSILGIPAALLLGVLVGVLRLSPNLLVRGICSLYVEIFRNTPLLLQLVFWAFAVFPPFFNSLPPVNDSIVVGGTVINSSGIYLPALVFDTAGLAVAGVLVVATCVALWFLVRHARRQRDRTGKPFPTLWWALGIVLAAAAVFYFVATPYLDFDYPVKKGLNFRGGFRPPIQLLILWFGLVMYTAAFISECVRAGILSVSPGQSEAAMAVGLGRTQRMRLVIMPQALRVIIPPCISQFLNLTKNSSLAVAVGYPDINNVWTGIALNQTGQSLIIIGMTVLVYECISLLTSWVSNTYNKSVQIKER